MLRKILKLLRICFVFWLIGAIGNFVLFTVAEYNQIKNPWLVPTSVAWLVIIGVSWTVAMARQILKWLA